RRHTRSDRDWSSDVCSSDLGKQKPITVANFLNYLDQGRYFKIDPTTGQLASTFVHRSIPGFIIQGGGYIGTVDPAHPASLLPTRSEERRVGKECRAGWWW